MQNLAAVVFLGFYAANSVALNTILGANMSRFRGSCEHNPQGPSYGNNKCRCIGVDNLKGYYAAQVQYHHVQYNAETGASCEAWDQGKDPRCQGSVPPQWCSQKWCYVDPCSCDLDVLPKQTVTGVEYQGTPAYWSYATCGGTDFFSETNEGACVNQKTEGDCGKQSKCAWDGKQCAGKEIVKTCKENAKKDESVYGEEDCRCIGLGGKDIGKAFMYMDEKNILTYSPNVGATCQAWESTTHPDCLKDGDKPSWCSEKWCFVDPCKCKTKSPPKAVMPSNRHMRFQGKTAYWSYATCGSTDSWSSQHKDKYCVHQETEAACAKLSKCAWNGKECLGRALVDLCEKQESSGVLGVEAPDAYSGASSIMAMNALLLALVMNLLH